MRLTRFAAVGVASVVALSACGSASSSTSAGTTSSTPKPATIKLWLAGKSDTPKELTDWLTTTFEKQHPGSTLSIEHIDWGELMPRLQTALSNPDQTPDVFEVGNTQSPTFTSVGAFTDLTGRMSDLGGSSIGPKGFLEAGAYDGKQYAVPYYWGSRYIFFSKKAFADANIAVPTTLAEFDAAAVKLQQAGKDKTYSGLWLPGQDWRNGISWIFANGGDIAKQVNGTWKAELASPQSVKGLTELQGLYQNATTAPKDGKDAEPWTAFNNGEAAMFMAPSWARWSIDKKLTADVGALALPGVDGGAAPVFAGGSNIGISAKSQHQQLAYDLLKLIYSDDYQKMLAKNGLGPAKSSFTSEMGTDQFATAAIAAASQAKLTPASPAWAGVESSQLMEQFFGKIAAGADVKTTAQQTDAALDKALNNS